MNYSRQRLFIEEREREREREKGKNVGRDRNAICDEKLIKLTRQIIHLLIEYWSSAKKL